VPPNWKMNVQSSRLLNSISSSDSKDYESDVHGMIVKITFCCLNINSFNTSRTYLQLLLTVYHASFLEVLIQKTDAKTVFHRLALIVSCLRDFDPDIKTAIL
jgi:hypothetical protein